MALFFPSVCAMAAEKTGAALYLPGSGSNDDYCCTSIEMIVGMIVERLLAKADGIAWDRKSWDAAEVT
jgi:hypothetical protein